MIYAKVIADSISDSGDRLTTIECQFPRFILAEVNTHRAFSRNSASSRAIPTKKIIQQVRENPVIPVEWGKNQSGMQASEELDNLDAFRAEANWVLGSSFALSVADYLAELGVHKQVVNRLLEPFMWHKAIISSTEAGWKNFLDQRLSPLAQPEMQDLAGEIYLALTFSEPDELGCGDWHLPYVDVFKEHDDLTGSWQEVEKGMSRLRKLSAARCARVSYLTHEGTRDEKKDLKLYQKLITADPPHWSPLEHVATPALSGDNGVGNFDGWDQLRHLPEYQ